MNSVRAVERGLSYRKAETAHAIRAALTKAGIVFLSDGEMGEGVRLAKPARRKESKS